MPPLALFAGYFLDLATRRISVRTLQLALCAAAVVLPLMLHVKLFFVYGPDEVSRLLYPGNPFVESKGIAEYLKARTSPANTVLIVGSEPQILFYAQRRSASRYILTYPLMMDIEGAAERQVEMFADASRMQPAVIVVVNIWTSHLAGEWTSDYLFRNLGLLLERDYTRVYPADVPTAAVPPLLIYERRGAAPSARE
jgi:hypothetical protein